jgi:hypothetical protein
VLIETVRWNLTIRPQSGPLACVSLAAAAHARHSPVAFVRQKPSRSSGDEETIAKLNKWSLDSSLAPPATAPTPPRCSVPADPPALKPVGWSVQFFQPPCIDRVPFHQMIAQYLRGPDAELRAPLRIDAVANRDNGVEVVVFDVVGFPVCGSCCKKCNN